MSVAGKQKIETSLVSNIQAYRTSSILFHQSLPLLEILVGCLLYAVDLVFLPISSEGLQQSQGNKSKVRSESSKIKSHVPFKAVESP